MALTEVTEHRFETPSGVRVALVVTPTVRIRVGRDRLVAYWRGGYPGSDLDRELAQIARRRAGEDHVIVIRGRSDDGSGSWAFDEGLSESEKRELGYHLVRDQLATYRRMVASNVFALLHVDWGSAECSAYVDGARQLLMELEESSIPEFAAQDAETAAIDRVDRWILKHLTFFFTEPLDSVLTRVLSTQLPKLESRIPHLREMVQSLPASVR